MNQTCMIAKTSFEYICYTKFQTTRHTFYLDKQFLFKSQRNSWNIDTSFYQEGPYVGCIIQYVFLAFSTWWQIFGFVRINRQTNIQHCRDSTRVETYVGLLTQSLFHTWQSEYRVFMIVELLSVAEEWANQNYVIRGRPPAIGEVPQIQVNT